MLKPLLFCVILLLTGPLAWCAAQEVPTEAPKSPLPNSEQLAEIQESIHELYEERYAAAESNSKERSKLAKALLVDSLRTELDLALFDRYALLAEALELATRSSDLATALEAIDEIDARYQPIDAFALRSQAVLSICEQLGRQSDKPLIARTGLSLVDEALDNKNAAQADRILKAIRIVVKRIKKDEPQLQDRYDASKERLKGIEKLLAALAVLETNPADEDANLAAGWHYAFVDNDFVRGCELLQNAATSKIADCSRLDFAQPTDSKERIDLARKWRDWAKRKKGRIKELSLERAKHWYRLALEEASPLAKGAIASEVEALEAELAAAKAPKVPADEVAGPDGEKAKINRRLNRDVARAVAGGIEWLVNHQASDGRWSSEDFGQDCTCEGEGDQHNDVGTTGLALLALQSSAGPTGTEPVNSAIARGLTWLETQQDQTSGLFGSKVGHSFHYSHAIAVYAIAASLKHSSELDFKGVCQKGVDYICAVRAPNKAWRYGLQPGASDTSVTSWMVSALSAARELGLQLDSEAFDGALSWLDSVTDPQTGRTGYTSVGSPSARIGGVNDHFPSDKAESMTAAAIAGRQLMGQSPDEFQIVQAGSELLLRSLPEWEPEANANEMLYWYYGTEALYPNRASWKRTWQAWEKAVNDALLESQEREAHAQGSWSPVGPWGYSGGRVYSTALAVLTLSRRAR